MRNAEYRDVVNRRIPECPEHPGITAAKCHKCLRFGYSVRNFRAFGASHTSGLYCKDDPEVAAKADSILKGGSEMEGKGIVLRFSDAFNHKEKVLGPFNRVEVQTAQFLVADGKTVAELELHFPGDCEHYGWMVGEDEYDGFSIEVRAPEVTGLLRSVVESYEIALKAFPEGSVARGVFEGSFIGVMPRVRVAIESLSSNKRGDSEMDLEKVVVTVDNIDAIRDLVGFVDLREEVKVGQTVSVNRFQHEGGQSGAILVVHDDPDEDVSEDPENASPRAGICFGGNSDWGDWDEGTQTVCLDDPDSEGLPVVYDLSGKRVE